MEFRACLVSPSKTRQATYWAHPKVESPHTDAWLVALGKGDLMQKEELEKTKNWLVGDEKGVKLRACLVSPSKTRQATYCPSAIYSSTARRSKISYVAQQAHTKLFCAQKRSAHAPHNTHNTPNNTL